MTAINWAFGVSGDWDNGLYWTGGVAPGPGDDATIAATGSYTVTVSSADTARTLLLNDVGATVALNSGGVLTIGATLNIAAGALQINYGATLTIGSTLDLAGGSLTLNRGGVIDGGTLSAGGGSFVWNGGTVNGITYAGDLAVAPNAARTVEALKHRRPPRLDDQPGRRRRGRALAASGGVRVADGRDGRERGRRGNGCLRGAILATRAFRLGRASSGLNASLILGRDGESPRLQARLDRCRREKRQNPGNSPGDAEQPLGGARGRRDTKAPSHGRPRAWTNAHDRRQGFDAADPTLSRTQFTRRRRYPAM